MPNQLGKRFEEFVPAKLDFVMQRANVLGNFTGIGQFAVSFLAVANRIGLDLLAANFAGQRSDRTGVEATT